MLNNFSLDFQNKIKSTALRGVPRFPTLHRYFLSLTSADFPLTEITFTQSNPISTRDDAVAPRGSRQRALQRHPAIHSTRNGINPRNSKLRLPNTTRDFPSRVSWWLHFDSMWLLCRTFANNQLIFMHLQYNKPIEISRYYFLTANLSVIIERTRAQLSRYPEKYETN